jgi:hypothetical protein
MPSVLVPAPLLPKPQSITNRIVTLPLLSLLTFSIRKTFPDISPQFDILVSNPDSLWNDVSHQTEGIF